MQELLCGIDIGGTFTDCVVVDPQGRVTTSKAGSTPSNFAEGVSEALSKAAQKLGIGLTELVGSVSMLSHGTTIGTNALIERRGARVGLITTKGHEHVIHIMRGSRGLTGRDLKRLVHFPSSQKPDPIVPKRLIRGISERVDCFGREIAPLRDDEVENAARELLELGVEAFAICFLWSFKAPDHELRAKRLIQDVAPGTFVTCSYDLVPKWGEYERTTATVLNAHMGPVTSTYFRNLNDMLRTLGYEAPLQITQCGGGTISVERAMAAPLLTLDSGPVAGVTGSAYLGAAMGCPNIITADMGGTSFDVGVIRNHEPSASYLSIVNQYEYFVPRVDIRAIGAGGGSIAHVDDLTGTLKVGPASAGSQPGPVCYGRGGTLPTVTDANVVLGRLDPATFAADSMKLDHVGAEKAIARLGSRLGMSTVATAAGIVQIAESNMADLVRQVTIQKGFDPREFVFFCFGGAGPLHAAVLAEALGIARVIIPQRETASVWCAFGSAAADILHIYEKVEVMRTPWIPQGINAVLIGLRDQARTQLELDGVTHPTFSYSIDVRHKGQINEVEITVPSDTTDDDLLSVLAADFYIRYEELYGTGSSFRAVALEAVTFRCRARAETPKPFLSPRPAAVRSPSESSRRATRPVWWSGDPDPTPTSIYDGMALQPGTVVSGPALVETPDTTVAVPSTHQLRMDEHGNFELTAAPAAAFR